MIAGIVAGAPVTGGGGGGSFYDEVMAKIAAAGGGYYFRMGEASGLVMENEVGADGAYNNVTLGKSPLYPGGGTSCQVPTTSTSGSAGRTGGMSPALTQMSIGGIVKFNSIGSMRSIFSNDSGSAVRRWQWRTNGTEMDWVKIAGGIDTKTSSGAGLASGTPCLLGVDIADSGVPGFSIIQMRVNNVVCLSTTIATTDYGSFNEFLEIGWCTGGGGLGSYADFSEMFIIADSIGPSGWSELFAASGL